MEDIERNSLLDSDYNIRSLPVIFFLFLQPNSTIAASRVQRTGVDDRRSLNDNAASSFGRHLPYLQASSECSWRPPPGNMGIVGVINEGAGDRQGDVVRQR